MDIQAWFEKNFDRYNRIARVYPALLVLGPVLWSGVALFPTLLDGWAHSATFAVMSACLLYFVASVARFRGKIVETHLVQKWGGWHTTILLRHSDNTIDPITKARYHRVLSGMCGVPMPSLSEESAQPSQSDDIYRSATKKLIELRRSPEFDLIHNENASYGFRRNLLGVKPIALSIILVAVFLTAFALWLVTPQPYTRLVIANSVVHYPYLPLLIAADTGYLFLWLTIVREKFVSHAATEYAVALLRSLDG